MQHQSMICLSNAETYRLAIGKGSMPKQSRETSFAMVRAWSLAQPVNLLLALQCPQNPALMGMTRDFGVCTRDFLQTTPAISQPVDHKDHICRRCCKGRLLKYRAVMQDLIDFVQGRPAGECGIVYCQLRKTCDLITSELSDADIDIASYHAGESFAVPLCQYPRSSLIWKQAKL